MSFNYGSLTNTASRLINEFGAQVTVKLLTLGSYDPTTGASGDTEQNVQFNAVRLDFNNSDIDGTLIQQGDFELLIDGQTELKKDDSVIVDGVLYRCINVRPLQTGDTRLLTKAQCRK